MEDRIMKTISIDDLIKASEYFYETEEGSVVKVIISEDYILQIERHEKRTDQEH